MNAFLPHNPETYWFIAAGWLGGVLLGFAITRLRSLALGRAAGWLLMGGMTALSIWVSAPEPPLVQVAIFFVVAFHPPLKTLVSVETQGAGEPRLPPLTWLAFGLAGATMRPTIYATMGDPPLPGAFRLLMHGIGCIALGGWLCWLAREIWKLGTASGLGDLAPYLATLALVPGISLMIVSGMPSVTGAGWRWLGVDWRSILRSPFQSHSLGEFWGRRWNLAFIEATTFAVYRPLRGIVGDTLARVASFAWSGAVHELLITVPVKRGYGIPTAYFAVQCLGVFLERGLERIGWPISRIAWLGRLWTLAWFAIPLGFIAPLIYEFSRLCSE